MTFWLFLNSNLLQTIAVLGTVLVAYRIYLAQKRDTKRDAANIILSEIRHAERLISDFRRDGISIKVYPQLFMPRSSWGKYKHLFIKDFDDDDINAVDDFYNRCVYIDKALAQLSIASQLEQKANAIHALLPEIAWDVVKNTQEPRNEELLRNEYDSKKKITMQLVDPEPYIFSPSAPKGTIVQALQGLVLITSSNVGSKLKKIALKK